MISHGKQMAEFAEIIHAENNHCIGSLESRGKKCSFTAFGCNVSLESNGADEGVTPQVTIEVKPLQSNGGEFRTHIYGLKKATAMAIAEAFKFKLTSRVQWE